MIEIPSSEEFIDNLVKDILRQNPLANIAVIGPSTLDRDHSLLYFSDTLQNTDSNLLAIDLPSGKQNISYGSLKTLRGQMYRLLKKYPHLKKPQYIEQDVYNLDRKIAPNSIHVIYDHDSLINIVHERHEGTRFDEAINNILKMYAKCLVPNGKMIIMTPDLKLESSPPPDIWDKFISRCFNRNNLDYVIYEVINDIDLREKYPELTRMRGYKRTGHDPMRGPQNPCFTMGIATKR